MDTYVGKGFARYEWQDVMGIRTLLLRIDCDSLNHPMPLPMQTETSSLDSTVDPQRLILIVPGNPGSIQFYEEFALSLWEFLGSTQQNVVWGISHAGHVSHPDLPKETFDGKSYPALHLQIAHKVSFIRHFAPQNIEEIVFIGHSIGAFISLKVVDELLKTSSSRKKLSIIGLFPTIERMAITPHGRIYTPVLRYFRWLLFLTVYGLSWLPDKWHRVLFRWYGPGMADHHFDAVKNLTNIHSFRNSILMAKDEMNLVGELDTELIERHVTRTILYYGSRDHWCPADFHTNIKQLFPEGRFLFCDKGYDHAFVLRQSVPVARLVADWIL